VVGLVVAFAPLAAVPSVQARAPLVAYQQEGTGQFRLYDSETQTDASGPPLPTDLDYGFRRVTISHNGRFVVYRRAGKVRLFDRANGIELRIPALGNGSFVTVTNDGNRIAYDANSNKPTSVYDRGLGRFLTNDELKLPETGGENSLRQPVFSGDGRYIVGTEFGCVSGDDSDTCLYEVEVGKVALPEIDADDEDPCIDGDGSLLAVTAPTGPAEPHDVFELDRGASAPAFSTPAAVATAAGDERFCFIDPSGRYLAYGADGVESLYDRQTGTFLPLPSDIERLAGLSDPYVPAPTGPRKPVVAYLDASGLVKLFDSHTGRQLADPGVTVPGTFKRWTISQGGRFIGWVEESPGLAIHVFDRETASELALPGINASTSGGGDRPGSLTLSDTGLIGFDRNGQGPTRVYDSNAGVFLDTGFDAANGHTRPSLSGDGRFLATNCISGGLHPCEVELDGNDNAYVQNLTTKTDTGFPENLTGSSGQDQQRPCIDGDGSRVAVHAIPPAPATVQKDIYLYDRAAAASVPLPAGVNDAIANDANCRLDASGQYLGIADEQSGAFRLYSLLHDGFALLPADAASPLGDVFLTSIYPPEPEPAPSGGGSGGGGGAPPLRDRTPPRLRLAGRRSQRLGRRGELQIVGVCDEACALAASGTVVTSGTARTFRLRRARRALRGPGRTVLRLRLSKARLRAVRRALARGRKAQARIRVTARDLAGNSASARRTIRVRR
jgi:hypothetical protein